MGLEFAWDAAIAPGLMREDRFCDLLESAAAIRDANFGSVVTYSPKVFVPLTTMCRNTCKYCTFVKQPGDPAARYMTPDEVMATVREGERAGCGEALFSLGENPEARYSEARAALDALGYGDTLSYVVDMCARVCDESTLIPHVNAGAISKEALARLKPYCGSMGMMLETASVRLMRPGQAHHACPDKAPKVRLRTIQAAGELKIPFTTGILIGIGESWAERIEALLAIKDIHLRYGHIQEVIVQNFRAKPGTESADWPEPTLDDMLLTLAAARVILPADISLQAPPNLADAALAYLDAGINDWGGISPVTPDFINPERQWPHIATLRENMAARGFILKERLTVYPGFVDKPGFLDPAMRGNLAAKYPSLERAGCGSAEHA